MPSIQILTATLLDLTDGGSPGAGGSPTPVVGAGDSQRMSFRNKLVQITIGGTATVDIEGSNDNTNWTQLTSVSASGKYENTEAWKYLRGNLTAWTDGDVKAVVSQSET